MTRGRVLQKFLPEPIREVRREGWREAWPCSQLEASEEAKIKWPGELQGKPGGLEHTCFLFPGLCLGPALCNC